MNRWKSEKEIILLALKDEAFRNKLLAEPKGALSEASKGKLSGKIDAALLDKDIKIYQEQKDEWMIVLPLGLTTKELEQLAGKADVLMNRWEVERELILAASKDPKLKQKLLSQPKEALKEVFKDRLSGKMDPNIMNRNIKTYEEKKNEWVIAWPWSRKTEGLTEKEMEQIAGGTYNWSQ